MRTPRLRSALASVLLLAASAPLGAQAVGIGIGFGLGTRTGFTITAGVQVTREVQLVCKAGGFPMIVGSTACGTHLYLFDDPDRFVVAQVGYLYPAHHPVRRGQAERDTRWLFFEGGFGIKDHELPDDDDDGEPEYERWANASYSGGLTLVFAKQERSMTFRDSAIAFGPRRTTRSLWPLFFLDAGAEFYVPGRTCKQCGY